MKAVSDILSLEGAKNYLRENWEKGCSCPACGQHVQLYKRKLNSGMAVTLIYIYIQDKKVGDFIQVKDHLRQMKYKNNHDWALLKYWGLIEEKERDESEDQKNSGYWKITESGKAFAENKISLPKHIYLYNGKRYKMNQDSETITITQAMGEHFSYNELMGILSEV